ncbi:cucumber peeling cupredoxin-like [Thalictrum thalictroides]|uniref:Cucumber peeling cupredoxin-like n=1 Tax=Thalictrum thalictroides TaxID=46969 RepID=A0A7J6VIL9_THATH|nr:cucumber peeling cupredoxin-like [Thalictrum thalictroides]
MASYMGVIVCLLVVSTLLHSAAADTYVVLDNLGWTIPSGNGAYSTWATNKDFEIGDVLVFNFRTGQHDVAEVTKANYDSCNSASPLFIQSTGPANVTLGTSGEHYYICTFGTHCQNGQKLAIVVESSSDSPPPSNTPPAPSQPSGPSPPRGSTTPSGPSPPNSASSVTVGGFISALLSTVIVFLF